MATTYNNDEVRGAVPNRLPLLREAQGLSIDDLAAEFGVWPQTVLEWEAKGIPACVRVPLARFFGVSVAWLEGA